MNNGTNHQRRRLLLATATLVGSAGAAASFPFAASMLPSEKVKQIGGDIEVDISGINPGELKITKWRGRPVWILRRTPEMLDALISTEEKLKDPDSIESIQPDYARNRFRSIESDFLVVIGICTHLGCSPMYMPEHGVNEIGKWWKGGFYCPCHQSEYDLAGRVYKGRSPAPRNLAVPPYRFIGNGKIRIGDQA